MGNPHIQTDYNSHHDKQHKISTAQTLLHKAATLPNTNEGKQKEHVNDALLSNGYPRKFLQEVERKRTSRQEKSSSPEQLVQH